MFSTLDPLLQETAESALSGELDRLDRSARKEANGLEGVVVVTTPQTGEVVGADRRTARRIRRLQPRTRCEAPDRLARQANRVPRRARNRSLHAGDAGGRRAGGPQAAERRSLEAGELRQAGARPVPMVRALTQSLNLATVNIGLDVGLDRVAHTFEQLGLAEAPAELPSMLLGATNLSPLEVTQVYNTLANGGFRAPLRAVRAVVDEAGQPLKAPELEVVGGGVARGRHTLDRMLIEVMERGTGRAAKKQLPAGLVVAGKTGTSNDYRDSWFCGVLGLAPDRGVGRARRQPSHRPHRHDRRARGVVATDGVDPTSSFEPLLPDVARACAGSTTSPVARPRPTAMARPSAWPSHPARRSRPARPARPDPAAVRPTRRGSGRAGRFGRRRVDPADVAPVEAEPEVP